jgi:holin-like protein
VKLGKTIVQIGFLSVFYMLGTWIQGVFHLAIPGSLIGMFLLVGVLELKLLPVQWFELGGETLIAILPFLLLPSTVGLMNYGSFFLHKGVSLFITIIISTVLIIVIAGHTGQYLANRKEKNIS